jgi:hypothetical protein
MISKVLYLAFSLSMRSLVVIDDDLSFLHLSPSDRASKEFWESRRK